MRHYLSIGHLTFRAKKFSSLVVGKINDSGVAECGEAGPLDALAFWLDSSRGLEASPDLNALFPVLGVKCLVLLKQGWAACIMNVYAWLKPNTELVSSLYLGDCR